MKKIIPILFGIFFFSCNGPKPRKPVKVNTGSFYKESAERNKKLLAAEEAFFQKIIAQDTANTYKNSASGSWYYYTRKNTDTTYLPKPDDLVTMTYTIIDMKNDTIYSFKDIGILKYKVDKQELFPGLRNSVKLLKKGEEATFMYPSSLAYGYHGDGHKIGTNVPIKATLKIFEIEKTLDSIQN